MLTLSWGQAQVGAQRLAQSRHVLAEVTSLGGQRAPAQTLSPRRLHNGVRAAEGTKAQQWPRLGRHRQLPFPLTRCLFTRRGPSQTPASSAQPPAPCRQCCGTITQGSAVGPGTTLPASSGPSQLALRTLCPIMGTDTPRAVVHGLRESGQAHVKAPAELLGATLPPAGMRQGVRVPPHPQDPWVPLFPRLLGGVKAWRTWLPGGLGEERVGLTAFPSLLYGFDRSSVIRLNTQRLPRLTIC